MGIEIIYLLPGLIDMTRMSENCGSSTGAEAGPLGHSLIHVAGSGMTKSSGPRLQVAVHERCHDHW